MFLIIVMVIGMALPVNAQGISTASMNYGSKTLEPSEIAAKVGPAVVYIEVYDANGNIYGSGSGFIIDKSGKVVTNYHVIEDAYSAVVKTQDGKSYPVKKVLNANTKRAGYNVEDMYEIMEMYYEALSKYQIAFYGLYDFSISWSDYDFDKYLDNSGEAFDLSLEAADHAFIGYLDFYYLLQMY